jgi:endogenous inhibitor of DNA gyrase (YacG/DUF329 family)
MASTKPPGMTAKCPVCGRATVLEYRPFCSRRCADVDLSRWLRGTYAIPDVGSEDGDEAQPADGQGAGDDSPKR